MVNRSKAKGTSYETAVIASLRERGLEAERLPLNGAIDQGDLYVREDWGFVLIEAKARAKLDLAGWMGEALTERDAFAELRKLDPKTVLPVVLIKRRQKPITESFVLTTFNEFFAG